MNYRGMSGEDQEREGANSATWQKHAKAGFCLLCLRVVQKFESQLWLQVRIGENGSASLLQDI
jgi:hypothetical protein